MGSFIDKVKKEVQETRDQVGKKRHESREKFKEQAAKQIGGVVGNPLGTLGSGAKILGKGLKGIGKAAVSQKKLGTKPTNFGIVNPSVPDVFGTSEKKKKNMFI